MIELKQDNLMLNHVPKNHTITEHVLDYFVHAFKYSLISIFQTDVDTEIKKQIEIEFQKNKNIDYKPNEICCEKLWWTYILLCIKLQTEISELPLSGANASMILKNIKIWDANKVCRYANLLNYASYIQMQDCFQPRIMEFDRLNTRFYLNENPNNSIYSKYRRSCVSMLKQSVDECRYDILEHMPSNRLFCTKEDLFYEYFCYYLDAKSFEMEITYENEADVFAITIEFLRTYINEQSCIDKIVIPFMGVTSEMVRQHIFEA